MTVTVEQLTAAGVGRATAERYVAAQAAPATPRSPRRTELSSSATPIGPQTGTDVRSEVRQIATGPESSNAKSNIGTGAPRGHATPREVAAAAGVMHPLTFRVADRVASAKNHTRPIVRAGKLAGVRKSKLAEAWAKAAVPQLEQQRPAHHEPLEAPVRVELVLFGPVAHPHSVDGDNALGGILDALVAARILADDRPRIVRLSSVEWRPAPAWCAEITITPYEGPAA